MAYASEIDIKISETPKTTDPDLLPDLIDIYNALHILAQYTDQIREFVTKSPEGKPWESFPLENIIHIRAHVNISQGQICGPAYVYKQDNNHRTNTSFHGAVRGVPFSTLSQNTGVSPSWDFGYFAQTVNGVFGIALEDARAGELVSIALGPGILEVPGLRAGESVFAWSAYDINGGPSIGRGVTWQTLRNNGSLFRLQLNPSMYANTGKMHRIGVGVDRDAMYLLPSPLTRFPGQAGGHPTYVL